MADNQIPEISLPPDSDAYRNLIERLKGMYEAAIAFHTTEWETKHDLYQRLYMAIPRHAIKMRPFAGASNLFIPATRVITHSILAREDDSFFNQDPFLSIRAIGKPTGSMTDQAMMSAELLELYYQSLFKYVIPLRSVTKVALKENAIDGTAVLHARWNRGYVMQRIRDVDWKVSRETLTANVLGQDIQSTVIKGVDPFWREKGYRRNIEQAALDNTNLANLFVAPGSGSSLQWPDCPWYFIRRDLDWQACQYRKRNGYEGVDEDLKASLSQPDTDLREQTAQKEAGLTPDGFTKTTPLCEFYMRLPLPGTFEDIDGSKISQNWEDMDDGWEEEVIVSVWWRTKTIARIRPLARVLPPNPAGIYLRPHVDLRYQKIPRFFYGMGIPQMMFHMNKALNQYMNQGVDSGTLRNVPFFFYEPSVGLMPDLIGIEPGKGIAVGSASGVKIPQFNGDNQFFTEMMQIVQQWAERDSSVNDFNMGRGSDSTAPGAQTARMGIAMLNESNLAFTGLASEHGEQVEHALDLVHLLHQRNASEYLQFRQPDSGSKAIEQGQIAGAAFRQDVEIRMQINPNRAAEQQNAQALFQFLVAIPFISQIPRAVRALAKNAWDKMGTPGTKPDFETEIWPTEIYQLQEQVAEAGLQKQAMQAAQAMQPQPAQQPPGVGPLSPGFQGPSVGPPPAGGPSPLPQSGPPQPATPPTQDEQNVRVA